MRWWIVGLGFFVILAWPGSAPAWTCVIAWSDEIPLREDMVPGLRSVIEEIRLKTCFSSMMYRATIERRYVVEYYEGNEVRRRPLGGWTDGAETVWLPRQGDPDWPKTFEE